MASSASWDPEWIFATKVAAGSSEYQKLTETIRAASLEHLGEELAASPEMVEYIVTLVASHKPMREVVTALAEVLGDTIGEDGDYSQTSAFPFVAALSDVLRSFAASLVKPAARTSGPPAASRMFANAVAAVRAPEQSAGGRPSQSAPPVTEVHGSRPEHRAHEIRASQPARGPADVRVTKRQRPGDHFSASDSGSRKIVVVKRSGASEAQAEPAGRPIHIVKAGGGMGYGLGREMMCGPARVSEANVGLNPLRDHMSTMNFMPDYGRPGVISQGAGAHGAGASAGNEGAGASSSGPAYGGIARPASFARPVAAPAAAAAEEEEEYAEDTGAESASAPGGRGRGRGMGRGRGRGRGGFMPTPQQIQMALAIVSQMAGGMPRGRGGFAPSRGAPRGRGRGGAAASHSGPAPPASDLKYVAKSNIPCKWGSECYHAVCPYSHPERVAQAGADASSSSLAPRKSSKFGPQGSAAGSASS